MRKWFDIVTGIIGILGTFSGLAICFTVALIGPENVPRPVQDRITMYLLVSMATFIVFAVHRLITGYPPPRNQ